MQAEVKQHRSEHDAWSIYNGKVYNITPFLHYHPGGVSSLLRGAGTDLTGLFNKYHR
jgi:cytochrome b involved in lipid metabolism